MILSTAVSSPREALKLLHIHFPAARCDKNRIREQDRKSLPFPSEPNYHLPLPTPTFFLVNANPLYWLAAGSPQSFLNLRYLFVLVCSSHLILPLTLDALVFFYIHSSMPPPNCHSILSHTTNLHTPPFRALPDDCLVVIF